MKLLIECMILLWSIPIVGFLLLYFARSELGSNDFCTCSNCGHWNYSFAKSCRNCGVVFQEEFDSRKAYKRMKGVA
ncbi:MAG: hypothetical protein U9R19_18130 [Bacteroidota bacterium]|nr:hypothetical protein [Bacteroidota bacterium]